MTPSPQIQATGSAATVLKYPAPFADTHGERISVHSHPRYHSEDSASAALIAFANLPDDVRALLGCGGRQMMRRLCREAPGTYFHSARILDLMYEAGLTAGPREHAAVLTHDIGKLLAPSRFAENAVEAADATKPPDPWVMAGHVDFGMKLADDAQLDDLARIAILQHHGTQTIGASTQRYAGQVPSTPFACALMMADTIEAIHSAGDVDDAYIWSVHARRMRENQFDLLDSWTCESITRDLLAATRRLGWLKPQSDVA